MDSFLTVIIIAVIIVMSVVGIGLIQKKEKAKELLRQKISQHRYRANQASTILGNFSQLPIGTEARQILMLYCLGNLKAIKLLSPNDLNIDAHISEIEQSLSAPQSVADKQKLTIPADSGLLKKQISQLTTLAKFIVKLSKSNLAQKELAPVAVNKIMSLISESKICAYIQQGKNSLANLDSVSAQRSFIMAQQMMLRIPNKNARIQQIEVELQELISNTPIENLDMPDNDLTIETPDTESPNIEKEEDDLFGPKKKW